MTIVSTNRRKSLALDTIQGFTYRAQFSKGLSREIVWSITRQILWSRCSSTVCRTVTAPARTTNPKPNPCHLFPYFPSETGASNQPKKATGGEKSCSAWPCCTFIRGYMACITGKLEQCYSTASSGSCWIHCFHVGESKRIIKSGIL